MKYLLFILLSTITFLNIFAQTVEVKKDTIDFYFENSKNKWNEESMIWKKNEDLAILRIRYWRGDCCGGVPMAEQITAKIIKDTVFYNLNIKRDPNCRTEIGLCGNAVDFVINTKKYPDYKKMVFKEIFNKVSE
ncbi:hypothetical protein D3C87_70170 [compost metagenome]